MILKECDIEEPGTGELPGTDFGTGEIVNPVKKKIRQVADSDFSVLLEGETGVGKTLSARLIHRHSRRRHRPFIKVDIAAIPETLLESELFGYKKGAFTGANSNKKGFFEAADGGTLFLDELENLPAYAQSKLLSVVEDREVIPLGTTIPVKIDVRIISATNTNLKQAVREKSFREDLYFRLCEFDIRIPPLRERHNYIHALALKFLSQAATELRKQVSSISDAAFDLLTGYSWPGNARELKNVIRRAVLVCDNHNLSPVDFQHLLREHAHGLPPKLVKGNNFPGTLMVTELEKWAIRQALTETRGRQMKAAILVGMEYQKFKRKLKKYAITV